MAIVNAAPGAETLRNPGLPKLLHIHVGDKEQIEKIVAHIRTLGMTRLAALSQDIPVGTSAMAGAQEEVKRAGGVQISGVKSGMNPAQLARRLAEALKRSKDQFTPMALAKALHTLEDVDLGGYGVNFARSAAAGWISP